MTTRERLIQCIDQARAAAVASPSLIAITGAVADALIAAGLIVTPEERECVEACVAFYRIHAEDGDYGFSSEGNRVRAAGGAILAARGPKPAWRVDEDCPWIALGPNGELRSFWKNTRVTDNDSCAREVARLNAEAAK